MIYSFVVVDRAYDEKIPVLIPSSGALGGPGLLYVNHQLQTEASEPYFKLNDVRAILDYETKGHHIRDWCYAASRERLQSIQSLTIELDPAPSWSRFSAELGTSATSQQIAWRVCQSAQRASSDFLLTIVIVVRCGVRPEALRFAAKRAQGKVMMWYIGKLSADRLNDEMSQDVDWESAWKMLEARQQETSQVISHD